MNALVPTNIQLPAHLSDRMGTPSALAGAMVAGIGAGGSGFKRISIRGGRFRIREGSEETVLPDSTLRCVIVGASPNTTKSFYKGAYNPKATEEKKPDCFSNDGIRPDKSAEDPQSQTCAKCPQNEWGSKITDAGTKMKACADQKRLAVISADDFSEEPEVYLFQVTPAALTQFRQYGEQLASKGLPPEIVITEISFDPKEAFPKAQFKFGGWVEQSQVEVIDKLVNSDLVQEIIGQKPQEATIVEDKPKPLPVREKKAEYVAPPVVIEDAEYEDITTTEPTPPAPPVRAKGFGSAGANFDAKPTPKEPAAAATTTSSNLAKDIQSILEGMSDDD